MRNENTRLIIRKKIKGRAMKAQLASIEIKGTGKKAFVQYDYSNLKTIIVKKGICSWGEFCEATGLSRKTATDISQGRPIALDSVMAICFALSLPIEDVIQFKFVSGYVAEQLEALEDETFNASAPSVNKRKNFN